jgi:hypothetical protein
MIYHHSFDHINNFIIICDRIKINCHHMFIRDASFLSARLEPKLVLIRPTSKGDSLCLDAPGMLSLVLPKFPVINARSKFIKCRLVQNFNTFIDDPFWQD